MNRDRMTGGYAKIYLLENTCMTREQYYSEVVRGADAGNPVSWRPRHQRRKTRQESL